MKAIGAAFFWTIAAVLSVPAIVGISAGAAVIGAIFLVGLIVLITALAVMALSCLPVIWWCAVWQNIDTHLLLARIKQMKKLATPAN